MNRLKLFLTAPLLFAAIIIIAYLLNLLIPIDLNQYGLRPRSLDGLIGILLVVFLHGNFGHLFNNIVPLLILAILLRSYGYQYFIRVTVSLILVSGLLTWLLSPSSLIVGASGLVFAYFSYLITKAIRDKTLITMLVAAVVIISYGGLFFSLGQFKEGVSWTGHICGFASGILVALYGSSVLGLSNAEREKVI